MSNGKTKKKPIKAAKKGKQFERDVANALGHIFPNAERMLEYQASSVVGVDLQNTGEFDIQCKRHANYCSVGTIKEIQIKDPNRTPVLVTKGNKVPAMAVLPFSKFVDLLERIPDIKEPEEIVEAETKEIETTAKQIPGPEDMEDGERFSTPKKDEPSVDEDAAIRKLKTMTKVEVYPVYEGVATNGICAQISNGGETKDVHFYCRWRKIDGDVRAITSIEEYIKNNMPGGELESITVKVGGGKGESVIKKPEPAQEKVEEPVQSYSFL